MLFVYIRWGSSVFAPLVETLSDLQALTIVAEGCQRGLHKERCRVFLAHVITRCKSHNTLE